ncbi:MAG: EAL domain-containing protein [Hyphomicrobiales bacterium]
MFNRTVQQLALIAVVTLSFIGGVHLLYSNVMHTWNKAQLQDLTTRSVLRMELAADRAVSTMADVHIGGLISCSPHTIEAYRKLIFSVGSIKDLRLWDGGKTCAGFDANTLKLDLATNESWQDSRNNTIQLGASNVPGSSRFSVRWNGDDHNVVAVLSTGGLLDDMIPAALRSHLKIRIILDTGHEIASYIPDRDDTSDDATWEPDVLMEAVSDRYPLKAYSSISPDALWAWNGFDSSIAKVLIYFLGLLIGLLTSRAVFPPAGAIEEIDKALKNGEFIPFYQPIVALGTGKTIGFEMLARWKKPNGELQAPSRFIPLIENLNRVDALTFALLRRAATEIVPELQKDPTLKLTFNITPDQFLDQDFLPNLQEILILGNFPMQSLVIEITERQQIDDLELARKMVDAYSKKGIRIAIDDAGTGHNGLSSIQTLDARILKLDKFFIDGIVENEKSRQMVEMLCNLAKQYDMAVVAEGIETAEQAAVALAMGIHEAQGFYFSKPLPAEELLSDLNKAPVENSSSTRSEADDKVAANQVDVLPTGLAQSARKAG